MRWSRLSSGLSALGLETTDRKIFPVLVAWDLAGIGNPVRRRNLRSRVDPTNPFTVMTTASSAHFVSTGAPARRRTKSVVRWLSRTADRRLVPALARFFAENVSTCYISQTELWSGRAPDFAHWSPDLKRVIERELRDTLVRDRARRIAVVERNGELVGLSVVVDLGRHYSLLEDIVVKRDRRGSGVGRLLVRWLFRELRDMGKTSVFLESAGRNTAAHRFFKRQGFRRVSIAMCRRLAA